MQNALKGIGRDDTTSTHTIFRALEPRHIRTSLANVRVAGCVDLQWRPLFGEFMQGRVVPPEYRVS